jgi:tetratricopeptide (TPR) repeat protein
MRLLPFPIALAVVVLFLSPSLVWAVKPGDVIVIKQDAPLKVSGKVVGSVKSGEMLHVQSVRGAWVEVGEQTRGWVRTDNVLGQQESLEHIAKLLDDKPNDPALWITRAKMNLSTRGIREPELSRRLQAAENDLLEAARRAPANAEVRYYQAVIAVRRSQFDDALKKLGEAIELDSKDARFYAERGRLLQSQFRIVDAAEDYEQVVALGKANANMYNDLAWWYSTSNDSSLRDGVTAVKYATQACELTHYNNFMYVDTLAAACAEANDFPNAIHWQEEAIKICNDPTEKPACEARLKQYRLDQAYRDRRF